MANMPNADQYRDRNPNNGPNPQRRPGPRRPYPQRGASHAWLTGLFVGIAAGLGLWLLAGNPFFVLLGAAASAAIATQAAN